MKYLVKRNEMQEVDRKTTEEMGIPAIVLMERAALKVAEVIDEHIITSSCEKDTKLKILALCGTGNNGADGIAAARILTCKGYKAAIYVVGDRNKASALFLQQLEIAVNFGVEIVSNIDTPEYTIDENTILIDAIFGIGLNKDIQGEYKNIIDKINRLKKEKVFAVDIPSGISADSGFPLGAAVKADYTITFGYLKLGLVLFPGCEYAGVITVADIGFAAPEYLKLPFHHYTFNKEDLNLIPNRKAYSNKGSYGKILVIAGSADMSGAAYFSAKAAYRMGAGLVKILTNEKNRTILQTILPEALINTYSDGELNLRDMNTLKEEIKWADVVVIGPGIGRSTQAERLLQLVLAEVKVPIVIDGDALWLLGQKAANYMKEQDFSPGASPLPQAETMEEQQAADRISFLKHLLPDRTILTPHLKELSYLLHVPIKWIQENLLKAASLCTLDNNMVYAIKDARTIVAEKKSRYINLSGNNGMATGGSGDVLTGMIAGLLGQGLTEDKAAALGVYIHGLAGDLAAEESGQHSLMADDIINHISAVIKSCTVTADMNGGTYDSRKYRPDIN
ncbi:NAD(P)H-hydrate dehydratase [Anaerocolumna sp. AGMB13020]|uniref:NAD(P)H-hydrate dehydratase n=1 Tax=Anaerocolumna sp. AGMB13020 TaxID=3081750 RepID=UPI0029552D47|nr:NAD(P)H-hydrate dehydratase [Anaerocolumna sp. AGMB13020]WOO36328.1 NAD(P)H-hydrate dehydratase [Anaerocolumna sp. AGMB13020]